MKVPLLILLCLSVSLFAEDQAAKFAALPKADSVIASGAIEKSRGRQEVGQIEPVAVSGQSFGQAARVTAERRAEQPHEFQLRAPTTAAVRKGDRLLAVFHARAVVPQAKEGVAVTEFVFEKSGTPYTKSAAYPAEFGAEWRQFFVPFEAAMDHPAGDAVISFRAGYDPQTIEIGGVQVLNFGADFPREKLPITPVTYGGREPNAPWRKLAEERIERLRKGQLTVRVVDAAGKPVPGAKVQLRQKRAAFRWGSAVDAAILLGDGPDHERYRQIIEQNFNCAVLENDLKWGAWDSNRERALKAVDWLRDRGIAVRGHVLVWPGKENLPKELHPQLDQPEVLQATILKHIADEASALRGKLVEWDVVNEPYTNFDVQTAATGLGRKSTPDWIERHASTLVPYFKAAREADPQVKLDINDYSILETGGKDLPHQEHYERTIRQLLADGAPLQGIGIQGHFSEDLTPITRLWEILDRYAKFGLPIQITEFDINTSDETLQADYTRDFLTAMFAHESISGVLIWGFWEKRHWIPQSAPYRADWSLRPAGQVWLDLVLKQWRTNTAGATDASGMWSARAFHGDYEVAAILGDRTGKAVATLMRDGAEVRVVLP